MAVNSTHPEYDAALPDWSRARDVLAGEDAVKAAGEKYLPRLDSQTDDEFAAYRKRASFFNATCRTAEGYVGLMFRRPPFMKVPEVLADGHRTGVGRALAGFVNDADMLGTTLAAYAKSVTWEVMGVGRAGSLVDWGSGGGSATGHSSHRGGLPPVEERAYVSLYSAEQIINWRVERVNGRNVPTLIVLRESAIAKPGADDDGFELRLIEQVRVLKLVPEAHLSPNPSPPEAERGTTGPYACVVEMWQNLAVGNQGGGAQVLPDWHQARPTSRGQAALRSAAKWLPYFSRGFCWPRAKVWPHGCCQH